MRSTQSAPHGRNDPCACGSGRKFKWCCGGSQAAKLTTREAEPAQRTSGLSAEGDAQITERLTKAGNLRGATRPSGPCALNRSPAAHHLQCHAANLRRTRLTRGEPLLFARLELDQHRVGETLQ